MFVLNSLQNLHQPRQLEVEAENGTIQNDATLRRDSIGGIAAVEEEHQRSRSSQVPLPYQRTAGGEVADGTRGRPEGTQLGSTILVFMSTAGINLGLGWRNHLGTRFLFAARLPYVSKGFNSRSI